jgi:TetR/AcrR family transcriptional repressor of nem operon
MPWSKEHKRDTRRRIVAAASRLFRRDGYVATGVAAAMSEAGLTHGGFYAHFEHKRALLEDAIGAAFDEAEWFLLDGSLAELRGDAWLLAATRRYLSVKHRDAPERGCALPTLSPEVVREGEGPARVLAERVEQMIVRFAERLGGPDARARATAALACWVGGLVLARSVTDPARVEEVLAAARRAAVAAARERLAPASP